MKFDKDSIISFDLFDTLFFRWCGKPEKVFRIVELKLKRRADIGIRNFYRNRIIAEKLARRNKRREEVTIKQIYMELKKMYGVDSKTINKILSVELLAESEMLCVNRKLIKKVERLYLEGGKVLIVSDTYFSRRFIDKLLKSNGINKFFYKIYLSSEINMTKSSGRLFEYVVSDMNIDRNKLIHVGNNYQSDYEIPKRLHIRSLFYNTDFNNFEKILSKSRHGSSQASISRILRLSNNYKEKYFELGCEVAGPILFNYVYWILKSARRKNINCLYFVSRDGQILLKIAEIIKENSLRFKNIELRYLYGSRQAWALPSLKTENDIMESSWLFEKSNGVITLELVSERLEMRFDELKSIHGTGFIHKYKNDDELSDLDIKKIQSGFATNSLVRKYILKKSREKRLMVKKYLEQEMFFNKSKKAIVDLGWRGRMQDYLCMITENKKLYGFYFHLFNPTSFCSIRNKKAFIIYKNNIYNKYNLARSANFLEVFCTADHSQVDSYIFKNGIYTPVYKDDDNIQIKYWKYNQYLEGVLMFARRYVAYGNIGLVKKKVIMDCLINFIEKPNSIYSNLLSKYIFASDQNGKNQIRYCEPINMKELFKFYLNKKRLLWLEGSVSLSSYKIKMLHLIIQKILNLKKCINTNSR